MEKGKIKYWQEARGFGFIKPDSGGNDTFVHVSQLEDGIESLPVGTRVSYDIGPSKKPGMVEAHNVDVITKEGMETNA